MGKIRLLPGMKYMSGSVLYRPGDILPDTEDARALVKRGKAEWVKVGKGTGMEAEPLVPDSYEAKNIRTLWDLVKERGVDVPRGTNKAGIIQLLEAWDAQNSEDSGDD
jgi:hypothetical protein